MSATSLPDVVRHAKSLMDKAMENTRREFAAIRTGKATTALLDLVRVDAYGSPLPINQVGVVAAPEQRLLTVTVWDRGLVAAVDKAIRESELGLNPSSQGTLVRIPIPPLTEERRRDLVKVVRKLAEEGRVAVRHARHEAIAQIKKTEHVSEDDKKHAEREVQKVTDEHIRSMDELVQAKEAEIMEV